MEDDKEEDCDDLDFEILDEMEDIIEETSVDVNRTINDDGDNNAIQDYDNKKGEESD